MKGGIEAGVLFGKRTMIAGSMLAINLSIILMGMISEASSRYG